MMKRYVWLQIKRILRILPYVLAVTAVLVSCLALLFGSMMRSEYESEERQRFKVGIVGDTDNMYIDLGKTALESLDSTRFSVEMLMMTEEEAKAAMQQAQLSVYIVIPEGFVDAIRYGEVRTIRYVTTAGNIGVTSIVKDEITQVIVGLLTHSQKGIYGMEHALEANGQALGNHVTDISLQYADFVFDRSKVYAVEELGISDGLSLSAYYFCSMTVLLLYILGLPYAVLFIKKEYALERTLAAKGRSALEQMLCTATAYIVAMWLLVAVVSVALAMLGYFTELFSVKDALLFGVKVLPVAAMVAVCNLLLFEISDSVIGGVLLQFFVSIAMCYAAGCFYPIYTLPPLLQTVSSFLPTGIARKYLSACITGEGVWGDLLCLIVYMAVFFAAVVLVRRHKIAKRG